MTNEFLIHNPSPPYPPYHTGPTLEEAACKAFNGADLPRTFIPVHWSHVYNHASSRKLRANLQRWLDDLPDGKYFVVCTHDDAPAEFLPRDTLVFSGGGRVRGDDIIPIPLVGNRVPANLIQPHRDLLTASFVGSDTHPIRAELKRELGYDKEPDCMIDSLTWSSMVNPERMKRQFEALCRSSFALCPRGYGPTSFRLYEALQAGAVPVYISDSFWLPWTTDVNWGDFCLLAPPRSYKSLLEALRKFSAEKIGTMREKGRWFYDNYCTIPAILRRIEDIVKAS